MLPLTHTMQTTIRASLFALLAISLANISMTARAQHRIELPEDVRPYEAFTITVRLDLERGAAFTPFVTVTGNTIAIALEPPAEVFFLGPQFLPLEARIQGLAPGEYEIVLLQSFYVEDGTQVVETDAQLIVPETPPTTPVYAMFNWNTEHYFVTSSFEEAVSIQVDGWFQVDPGFNAWAAGSPSPEPAKPVCRFYSFEVNSHFYTADEDECSFLQNADTSWEYEGIAFKALVPRNNTCFGGTEPVWRLFNNRVLEMDSNHRFVASAETYRTMIADGWVGEGVAFCSPTNPVGT
jgi:hypothetical protein